MGIKLKNRLTILLCNAYVVLLCIAIVIVLPLQFILFVIKGNKNKLIRPLEDRVFKTLFYINDLRKNI
jgi:hypothetical protein